MRTRTAGSPVVDGQIWTNAGLRTVAEQIESRGFCLSPGVIGRILRETLGLGRRSISKTLPQGSSLFRNEQFDRIHALRSLYESRQWPVVSVDTKKKELIGAFSRKGKAWTDGKLAGWDHDFGSYSSSGKAIPYGVYDTVANEALVYLATGSDTGLLAADGLRRWWYRLERRRYQGVGGILVLADCGGSNGYRVRLYREQLQRVTTTIGIPIRVAHLPPYCSKYNPIDHRLFCHLTRSISGRLIESLEWLQLLFSRTTTRTGLNVICELARKVYKPRQKPSSDFVENETTIHDNHLGQFNYAFDP